MRIRLDRALVVCLVGVLLLSLVPLIPVVQAGGGWQITGGGYVDDMYVALAREVADGHPFAGNAFYIEHREELPVTFIVPYWLFAAPMMAGLPVAAAVEFNFVLWSLIFASALYFIFRKLSLPGWYSAAGTVFLYIVLYTQLQRPISMELVHPALLLFFLTFLSWWERPDTRRVIFLTVATVFALYSYTFLVQMIGIFLMLAFVYLLYLRDKKRIVSAIKVGAVTALLGAPFFALSYAQLHHPAYFETMVRTALAYSHLPAGEAFRCAFHVLLFIALACMAWVVVLKNRLPGVFAHGVSFLMLGASIVFLSFANVITGLDVETASHAARFLPLWLGMGFITLAYYFWAARGELIALRIKKKVFLLAFAVFVVVMCAPYLRVSFVMFHFEKQRQHVREVLAAQPAIQWLEARESEPTVIWTDQYNSSLWGFITIYTKHYILSDDSGNLQLLSNLETEERYLTATAASRPQPTLESIAADVWLYNGVGAAVDTPNTINRSVKWCRALRLKHLGYACGDLVDARTLYAEHYEEMYKRYTTEIRPRLREVLEKYHVGYILKDTKTDAGFYPEDLPFVEKVFSDERFEIYALK